MIRKEIAEGSDFGKMAAGIINKGELLSDEFVVALIETASNITRTWMVSCLTGFPERWDKLKFLMRCWLRPGHPLSALVSIDVPHDELMRRMLERAKIEGRADDNEEVIENRFREYRAKTLPVADHYKIQKKHFSVNGHGSVDDVFESITKILEEVR